MDRFFDEAARILASPMSRREAFSRLLKIAAGTLLAGAVAAPALAASSKNSDCKGERCCRNGNGGFCTARLNKCCGSTFCPPKQCCRHGQCVASCEDDDHDDNDDDQDSNDDRDNG